MNIYIYYTNSYMDIRYMELFDRLEVADLKTMAEEVERRFFTNNDGFNS